jgi:hypothetical protein
MTNTENWSAHTGVFEIIPGMITLFREGSQ